MLLHSAARLSTPLSAQEVLTRLPPLPYVLGSLEGLRHVYQHSILCSLARKRLKRKGKSSTRESRKIVLRRLLSAHHPTLQPSRTVESFPLFSCSIDLPVCNVMRIMVHVRARVRRLLCADETLKSDARVRSCVVCCDAIIVNETADCLSDLNIRTF